MTDPFAPPPDDDDDIIDEELDADRAAMAEAYAEQPDQSEKSEQSDRPPHDDALVDGAGPNDDFPDQGFGRRFDAEQLAILGTDSSGADTAASGGADTSAMPAVGGAVGSATSGADGGDEGPLHPLDDESFGESLSDPVLKQRLMRLAPRVSVEPALAVTLAVANRRRWQRRVGTALSVAAVVVAALLLFRTGSSDPNSQTLSAGDPATTKPSVGPADGTRLTPRTLDDAGASTTVFVPGTYVPGTYLPTFPSVPGGSSTTNTSAAPPPSTTSTARPAGEVKVSIAPASTSVGVGDRLSVEVEVENNTNATIAYVSGSSSCPQLARTTAGSSAGATVPGSGPGVAFAGEGAQIQDHLDSNTFGPGWVLGDPSKNTGVCTADLGTTTIAAGQTGLATLAFDADAAPGGLPSPSLLISASFTYWPSSADALNNAANGKTMTATSTVTWADSGVRTGNMSAVYNGVNTNPQVRAFLDGAEGAPERQFVSWIAFHADLWEFRFSVAGSSIPGLVAKVDPSSGAVVSVG